VRHLNDHIFISHHHDVEDGFTNLEESSEWIEDDRASSSSVVHRSVALEAALRGGPPVFSEDVRDPGSIYVLRLTNFQGLQALADQKDQVTITAELEAYLLNVVTFLRVHRAASSGISPTATRHFDLLARCLAPLHGLTFVTPALISLAARKIYRHRITIASATEDRSLQYGSDLSAVSALLDGIKPETVIEEVLQRVEVPL